jgi:hypothetical protein
MTHEKWMLVFVISVLVAGGSFVLGQRSSAAPPSGDPLCRWLSLPAPQAKEVQNADPDFATQSRALVEDLRQQRGKLATLVQDPNVADGAVLEQLDRVLSADAALQKRLTNYILKVRGHLTAGQREQLMTLYAQGMRGAGRGMGRGPAGDGLRDGHGPHGAGGMGRGVGPGGGRGWGAVRGGTAGASTPPAATTAPATPSATAPSTPRSQMGGPNNPHAVIMSLFDNHQKITRKVEEHPDGITSTTTSDDPQVAAMIRKHVAQMKARLAAGQIIRMFDPLFVEIFAHHEKIKMEVEEVAGGVKVKETSTDPQVVLLIKQHAKAAVSEFVDKGEERMHQATPLPEGYKTAK